MEGLKNRSDTSNTGRLIKSFNSIHMDVKRYKKIPGIGKILGLPIAYEVSAGAIIFRKSSDRSPLFLLLQYRHKHWDFVKGHIDAGETMEETVRRETKEETGLFPLHIIPEFHERVHFFYSARGTEVERRKKEGRALWIIKTVHFFLAEYKENDSVRLSEEHIDFAWLSFEEAVERATFENAKRILRRAKRRIESLCL